MTTFIATTTTGSRLVVSQFEFSGDVTRYCESFGYDVVKVEKAEKEAEKKIIRVQASTATHKTIREIYKKRSLIEMQNTPEMGL